MQIPGKDLRGYRRRAQPELCADSFFCFRSDVRECADRARCLARPQVFSGSVKAADVAAYLVIPDGQFQAERNRFGVRPMVRPI